MSSADMAMRVRSAPYSGCESQRCQKNPNTLIRLRTATVCRAGALWMEFTYGGYMCAVMIRVMHGTKKRLEKFPFPGMGTLGHRTIMCEYTFLTWLILLQLILLRLRVLLLLLLLLRLRVLLLLLLRLRVLLLLLRLRTPLLLLRL